ncbi:hypothetical protein F4818DRAFT_348962 [Hypoxylon cercidicola]|nr:hypothetical protein F4818DRAFT_348962 [Hypoxylon cercidicola]
MPEQTLYHFPSFVEHRTEKKPASKATSSKATASKDTKAQREKGPAVVSEITRRLSQGKRAKPEPTIKVPGVPEVEGDWTPPKLDSRPQLQRYKGPRAAEFLSPKMDTYVDMSPIKRGSFFYMSNKHVEKDDYFRFDEEHQTATF